MEVENVGGQQEEEEKEEDDLNISSDDSSSDDSSSDNNSSRGVRWRPREQVEAKEGPKELTEERRKQLAAAGKIGGEESTSLRLRPSFIRDREDTSGRFVLETLAHRIDRLTKTGGRKTRLGVKETKNFRSREKRRRDKEAKEDERGEDDFATAYAVLLEIHRNGTLDPSKHIYTDPDAMRAAGLEPRAADDFGRGKLLLPYKLRHAGLYRVHDLIKKGMDPTEAFKNVAVVFSVSERTLRTWKNEFYLNGFLFRRLLSGLHEGKTFSHLDDTTFCGKLRSWLRINLSSWRKKKSGHASKQRHAAAVQRSKEIEKEDREHDALRVEWEVDHADYEAICARNERGDFPKTDEGEPYFCLCGQPDDQKPMTQCEKCHDWFHYRCLEDDRVYEGGLPRTLDEQHEYFLNTPFFCGGCEIIQEQKAEMEGWEKEGEGVEESESAAGGGGEGGAGEGRYFVVIARRMHAYVNSELLKDNPVSLATIKRWIKKLGFSWARKKMTVFMDGHERFDVKAFRVLFLDKIFGFANYMMHCEGEKCDPVEPPSLTAHKAEEGREHVLVVHDESIVHSMDGCVSAYGEDGRRQGAAKSLGPSVMISGVLSEKTGRIAFRSKAEWNKFQRDFPETAARILSAYVKWHGDEEDYRLRMWKYGVQSANIIIFPGKVVLLWGGGREGGKGVCGVGEVFAPLARGGFAAKICVHTRTHPTEPRWLLDWQGRRGAV